MKTTIWYEQLRKQLEFRMRAENFINMKAHRESFEKKEVSFYSYNKGYTKAIKDCINMLMKFVNDGKTPPIPPLPNKHNCEGA